MVNIAKNGYKKDNVNEMDWFDKIKINDEITVTLPLHNIGVSVDLGEREILDRSLWGSFLIEYKGKKIFFACDTGPAPFYKQLEIKLAQLICIWKYWSHNFYPIISQKDKSVFHTNPEELLSLLADLVCEDWNALGKNCNFFKFREKFGTACKI